MSDYKVTSIKKFVVIGCGLISSALLARYLGPDIRADYGFIMNAAAILVVVLNLGVSNSFQKVRREEGGRATKLFCAFSIYVFLLLVLTALILRAQLQEKYLAVMVMAAVSLLRMQIQTYCLVDDIKGSSIASSIGSVLEVLMLTGLVLFLSSSLYLGLSALLIKELIIAAFSFRYLAKLYGKEFLSFFYTVAKNIGSRKTIFAIKKVVQSPMFFVLTVMIVINYKADVLVLEYMGVAKHEIGVFVIGVLVADYLWVFSDIFKEVQISRSARGSSFEDVASATRLAILVTVCVYLVFLVFGYFAIVIFYGVEFSGSYKVALLMLLANAFMIPCKIIGAYYISINRVGYYVGAMILAVFLNISVSVLLIPAIGVYGAILGNIAAYAVGGLLIAYSFCKTYSLSWFDVVVVRKYELVYAREKIGKILKRAGF